MIYVGIDVAKDKHDCFITNSDGEVLFKSFTISNNRNGFETLKVSALERQKQIKLIPVPLLLYGSNDHR